MRLVIVMIILLGCLVVGEMVVLVLVLADNNEQQEMTVLAAATKLDPQFIIQGPDVVQIRVPITSVPDHLDYLVHQYLVHPLQAVGRFPRREVGEGQLLTTREVSWGCFVCYRGHWVPEGKVLGAAYVDSSNVKGGQLYPGCRVDIHCLLGARDGEEVWDTDLDPNSYANLEEVEVFKVVYGRRGQRGGQSKRLWLTVLVVVTPDQLETLRVFGQTETTHLVLCNEQDHESEIPPPPKPPDQELSSETLEAPLTFVTGSSAPWFCQTVTSYDGQDAAQSGAVSDGQSSWLQTRVSGPGRVSFYWKVSSEPEWDYLDFRVQDAMQETVGIRQISGSLDWERVTSYIPADVHTLTWVYSKNHWASERADCAWIDQVEWVPE